MGLLQMLGVKPPPAAGGGATQQSLSPPQVPPLRACRPAATRAWRSLVGRAAAPRARPGRAARGSSARDTQGRRGRGRALGRSGTAAPEAPGWQRPSGGLSERRGILARTPRKLASICVVVALPPCAQHLRDASSAVQGTPRAPKNGCGACVHLRAALVRTLVASASSAPAADCKCQRCVTVVAVAAARRKRQCHNQRARQTSSSLRQRPRTVRSEKPMAEAHIYTHLLH